MQYREHAVPAELTDFVLSFWEFQVASEEPFHYDHHIPPDGCISLVTKFVPQGDSAQVIFVGPRTDSFVVPITHSQNYFGIRFWPFAAESLLGDKLDRSIGFVGPAQLLAPHIEEAIRKHISKCELENVVKALQDAATEFTSGCKPPDDCARKMIERIIADKGQTQFSKVADEFQLGQRQIQRRFKASTGLTPKQFARIRRFREAAAELLQDKPRPWVTVAHDAGFSDQSHLIREFSQMIGLTAEELKQKHAAIDHTDVLP